jgi:hypothetical protein
MKVFLFSKLCRIVPYFYDTLATHFFTLVSSPLTTRFPLTMVVSGFGPYHRLQPDDAPAECAGVTPTPWAIMPMLSCVSYHRGHELLVTPPPPTMYLLVLFLGEMLSFPLLYCCRYPCQAATTAATPLPLLLPPPCCRNRLHCAATTAASALPPSCRCCRHHLHFHCRCHFCHRRRFHCRCHHRI